MTPEKRLVAREPNRMLHTWLLTEELVEQSAYFVELDKEYQDHVMARQAYTV